MFPQKYKLTLRSLPSFFDEARRSQSGPFTIFTREQTTSSRCVVIVPKRVVKLATGRNATKRLVYTHLEAQFARIAPLNQSVVLIVQRPLSAEMVEKQLEQLVQQLAQKKTASSSKTA